MVEAMAGNPENEIIVVDNGSEDGSAEFLRERFPAVRVLALDRNLGFGGGSNEGFRAAKNDIVVLLNSDMRVQPDFLAPLLASFHRRKSLRRFVPDFLQRSGQAARRDRTHARLVGERRLARASSHRCRDSEPFPCFYGGGGSCAFDRRKFLELGGFDELLGPFISKTPTSVMAWKRGWKVLYQPRSVVYHEHRGTIGKRFSKQQIDRVLKKNFISVLLEKYSRMAAPLVSFLFHFRRRGAQRVLWRFAGAGQSRPDCGGRPFNCRGAPFSRACSRLSRHHR